MNIKNHESIRDDEIKMGRLNKEWKSGKVKNITLSLTQECNLRCKYCYMTKKNGRHSMSFKMAKRVVDYILEHREIFDSESVIWEFIGGEPLIEIDLIDQISDYIKIRMYELNHPWQDSYIFFMCTNGLLYSNLKVQDYIKRNHAHVSIGMTVDGNKEKHDLSRIKPDGSGSYDDVIKNVPLWLEQFPNSMTKSTFSHDDLPYIKDSIISLWKNGIKVVAANIVFEDVWDDNDVNIYENQLYQLADYIIENELWNVYSVRFFDPTIGFPLQKAAIDRPFCGTGKMLAVDDNGNFFPCIRFLDFCQSNGRIRSIGNVHDGLNTDKLRPFYGLTILSQSNHECIECEVASGCANCTGNDFDCSSCGTIFHRATYICEMHKACVRANKYFWRKYAETTKRMSARDIQLIKLLKDKEWMHNYGRFLYFITSDKIMPHCHYIPNGINKMSENVYYKGLKFCEETGYIPIFLGRIDQYVDDYLSYHVGFIFDKPENDKQNTIDIYNDTINVIDSSSTVAIFNTMCKGLADLFENVTKLLKTYSRVNIIINDKFAMNQYEKEIYEIQLQKIGNFIIKEFNKNNILKEVNVLTDIFFNTNITDCSAGVKTLALAPNGDFYPCPAFYFNQKYCMGNIEDNKNLILNNRISNKLPLCQKCDSTQCYVCKYINKIYTEEYIYPPKIQCEISFTERKVSVNLLNEIKMIGKINILHNILPVDYNDPQEKITSWTK